MSVLLAKELWHVSPVANRASIEREGLRPGNAANDGGWTPPWVCYAETEERALALTHGEGSLDLWLNIRPRGAWERVDGEWRTTSAHRAIWCGTVYRAPHPLLCDGCGHHWSEHYDGGGCMDTMSHDGPARDGLGFCPCDRDNMPAPTEEVDDA